MMTVHNHSASFPHEISRLSLKSIVQLEYNSRITVLRTLQINVRRKIMKYFISKVNWRPRFASSSLNRDSSCPKDIWGNFFLGIWLTICRPIYFCSSVALVSCNSTHLGWPSVHSNRSYGNYAKRRMDRRGSTQSPRWDTAIFIFLEFDWVITYVWFCACSTKSNVLEFAVSVRETFYFDILNKAVASGYHNQRDFGNSLRP